MHLFQLKKKSKIMRIIVNEIRSFWLTLKFINFFIQIIFTILEETKSCFFITIKFETEILVGFICK